MYFLHLHVKGTPFDVDDAALEHGVVLSMCRQKMDDTTDAWVSEEYHDAVRQWFADGESGDEMFKNTRERAGPGTILGYNAVCKIGEVQ